MRRFLRLWMLIAAFLVAAPAAAFVVHSNDELKVTDPAVRRFNDCLDRELEQWDKAGIKVSPLDYRRMEDRCFVKARNS